MKKYLFIVLLVSFGFGQISNPCEDERYLEIKNKSLDEMSDREYKYFMMMQKKCQSIDVSKDQSNSSSNVEQVVDYYEFGIKRGTLQAGSTYLGSGVLYNILLPVISWGGGLYIIDNKNYSENIYGIENDKYYKKIDLDNHKDLYLSGFNEGYKQKIRKNWNSGSLAVIAVFAVLRAGVNASEETTY
tara:strand:+ start:439 stop:999 length:561 start_codon:yes stop_codon:yes gene_type:complete